MQSKQICAMLGEKDFLVVQQNAFLIVSLRLLAIKMINGTFHGHLQN